MAFPAGEAETNRLTAQVYYVDASFGVIVPYDYEIGASYTTEIAALGVLEIL